MMQLIVNTFIGFVAILHLFFLFFEMFAWETMGRKIFRNIPKELFGPTKMMAANQGLYNGFLAAGLIWTFFIKDAFWQFNIAVFFLSCVSIAGIYGALTVSKKIFFVQAAPALIALILLHL